VHGSINMLGLAKRLGAPILLASTSEVYGDPAEHPQTESYWGNVNPIGVRSCYDEGKRCAETLFFDYHRQHALPIKVARIFNTYGPNMLPNDGRVVSSFIVQALRGEPLTIFGPRVAISPGRPVLIGYVSPRERTIRSARSASEAMSSPVRKTRIVSTATRNGWAAKS